MLSGECNHSIHYSEVRYLLSVAPTLIGSHSCECESNMDKLEGAGQFLGACGLSASARAKQAGWRGGFAVLSLRKHSTQNTHATPNYCCRSTAL